MEPEGSLPHSQAPAIYLYLPPQQSSPSPHIPLFKKSTLILSSYLRLGLPSVLFHSSLPTKPQCAPLHSSIRATYPSHLTLLDLMTWIKISVQDVSQSSSLCSLLHSAVTSSFLRPISNRCSVRISTDHIWPEWYFSLVLSVSPRKSITVGHDRFLPRTFHTVLTGTSLFDSNSERCSLDIKKSRWTIS